MEENSMKVLQRYFALEIGRAVLFALITLLALFSFFDLMGELTSLNQTNYRLQHALLFVALGMPGNVYEFMPIAVLIGTIYVMAQMAASSEFTIMRAASMSSWRAAGILLKISLGFVVLTFVFGEFVTPWATSTAKSLKLTALGKNVKQNFRTGLWTKDLIKAPDSEVVIGSRFINVKEVSADRSLQGVKIFEFDTNFQLLKEISAREARFQDNQRWLMNEVAETTYPTSLLDDSMTIAQTKTFTSKELISEITPAILSVLFVEPDRMSAYDLAVYKKHLNDNKQDSERYEIAFWKKLTYPFTVIVMMALALPFAYLQARRGGVSLRIFSGIMLGMLFYLTNSLFSHVGLINTWPALVTALMPSFIFLILAMLGLRYVERH
jgi:lipopolysaccharide export system permease protein